MVLWGWGCPAYAKPSADKMAQYLSDAVDYFKNLCVQHPDLLHSETSGERVFEVKAYEAAFGDFRTGGQEKAFFVRFILPTIVYAKSGNNARKVYKAGLMVGKYYSTREDEKTAKVEAWSAAERVADDFMARIVADSRNGHPLFFNSIDNPENLGVEGDFLDNQGDGSFAAVLYFFDFSNFRCLDAGGDEFAEWLDGGLTVYD